MRVLARLWTLRSWAWGAGHFLEQGKTESLQLKTRNHFTHSYNPQHVKIKLLTKCYGFEVPWKLQGHHTDLASRNKVVQTNHFHKERKLFPDILVRFVMTILTKTFKDVTIFSDKMKCFSLQTNNHGLHNGDQSRVDRGNGLSEFCYSAHISFCFILFTKATKLFSHSGGRQRFKNEAPWCFP